MRFSFFVPANVTLWIKEAKKGLMICVHARGKSLPPPGGKSTTKLELFRGLFELLKIDFSTEESVLASFIVSACQRGAFLSGLIREFLIIVIII